MTPTPEQPGLTRRQVVLGVAGTAMAMTLGQTVLVESASATTPPPNASAAASYMLQMVGKTRTQLNSIIIDAPWSSFPDGAQWCAWFASWFMRATSVGHQTFARDLYNAAPAVSSPAVGDIVFYPGDVHVGMVVGVTGGVAQVVEGNAGDDPGIVKYRDAPYAACLFSRPNWPAGSGGFNQGDSTEMWYSSVGNYGTATNGATNPPIRAGFSYLQGADGILRPVGVTESNARQQAGQTPTAMQASQIGPMAERLGVMEVAWTGLEPALTGRILYGANCATSRPAW